MNLNQPVPELPVRDVRAAQEFYRDHLGFEIAWHNSEGRIGAVSHGETAIFFRETDGEIHPQTFWIFAEQIDDTYQTLIAQGARIVNPIGDKPWGLRQFTIADLHGHRFHFHHDI